MLISTQISHNSVYTLNKLTADSLARVVRILVLLVLVAVWSPGVVYGQAGNDQHSNIDAETEIRLQGNLESLLAVQRSIEQKKNLARDLREQLLKVEETAEREDIELKIDRTRNDIAGLQKLYEEIALSGVNLSLFIDQPEEEINWKSELEQISRPILTALKDLTSKPRELDSLRIQIELHEKQLKESDKAITALRSLTAKTEKPETGPALGLILSEWEQRREDIKRSLEVSRFKLDELTSEDVDWKNNIREVFTSFILGRGLTIFLAIMVSLVIWYGSRLLLNLYWRWLYNAKNTAGVKHASLVIYGYRIVTALIILLTALMVFYVRGDILLLTLSILALAGAALSMRQTFPKYAAELRLLLGIGPVRQRERLVIDGVPLEVDSLSIYTVLRNPALEGIIRLPLHSLNTLVSRPASQQEPWFPCEPEDYIITASGNLGRVVRQTIEIVEISVLNSTVQCSTSDFLSQGVRNLSRNGFGISSTFGIDYKHQNICLDVVPERLEKGITSRLVKEGVYEHVISLLVEFKTASASSLDYQIYIVFNGRAASSYYMIQRLIQQACVETSNQEGWVIPFTQLTIHSEIPSVDNKQFDPGAVEKQP